MIERVEILPYHTLGVHKYEAMNLEYQLKDVKCNTPEQLEEAKALFDKYFQDCLRQLMKKNQSLHAVLGEYCHL